MAPFTAVYGAASAAACRQSLHAAYPTLSEQFDSILRREFSPPDLSNAFIATLKNRTSAQVDLAAAASEIGETTAQPILATATAQGITDLFLIEATHASLRPLDRECETWAIQINVDVALWNVAEGRRVLQARSGPYVNAALQDLKHLLDDPGSLRARFAPVFEVAATNMLEAGRPMGFRDSIDLPH
jgi:hypothetical protein